MKRCGWNISRRAFLAGAGAIFVLPRFESLAAPVIAVPQSPKKPVRFALLYMPNGAYPEKWNPVGEGAEFKLSPTLEPLQPHREDIVVYRGLWNKQSADGDGHYAKVAPLLTCKKIKHTGGRDIQNGISMDQVAANAVGQETPLASLELGTEPVRPLEDLGYSTIYGGHVAWRSATEPLPKEIVPRLVFDRLFRSASLRDARGTRSVLDVVMGEAKALSRDLARRDREKLDGYMESVRALEVRIDRAASETRGSPVDPARAPVPGVPADFPTHVSLMLDLMALAFEQDATRIQTFMFGNEVSGRDFSFLEGAKGSHHEFSHHENKPEKAGPYAIINRWYVSRFAEFLDRLKKIPEGEGTVLSNSVIVFASAMKDGNAHAPRDLPIITAGQGGGAFRTGRLEVAKDPSPLSGLWVKILRAMGVTIDHFADS